MESRRAATAANAIGVSVLVVAITVVLMAIAAQRAVRIDLSSSAESALLADTRMLLDALGSDGIDVNITAFSAQQRDEEAWLRDRTMRDFLDALRRHSQHVSTRFVDFDRERLVAESFGVERYGTVVVESRGDRVDVDNRDLFRTRGPRGERQVDFTGEAAIVAALRRVSSERATTLVFLTGHGERRLFDRGLGDLQELAQVVDDQGWRARAVDLLRDAPAGSPPAVPDDASAVVILGPKAPFAPAEEEAIRAFVGAGGAVALFIDRSQPLVEPLADLGLDVQGMAMDRMAYFPHADRPRLRYGGHPITEGMPADTLATIVASARALGADQVDGVRATPLLQTSSGGWIERGDDADGVFTEGVDGPGPAVVALAVEVASGHPWMTSQGAGRMLLVGDVDVVEDELLRTSPGNATFVANGLKWLLRSKVGFTPITRPGRTRRLAIGQRSLRWVQWSVVGGVPFLVLLLGMAVGVWRRRM